MRLAIDRVRRLVAIVTRAGKAVGGALHIVSTDKSYLLVRAGGQRAAGREVVWHKREVSAVAGGVVGSCVDLGQRLIKKNRVGVAGAEVERSG